MPAENKIDISVIIPVYGVEHFVERCTRSLMEQTIRSGVEFIFVDDATPDGSIRLIRRIVSEYPDREPQVTILTHSENRGLPAARNTGMDAARGEYVMHIDSDDYCEPQMAEAMLNKARQTDADMVWCDWFLSLDNHDRPMAMPDYATADEALRAMLGGAMKYNVWNKLTRRSVFTDNGLRFPYGRAMGEDLTMVMAAACCRRVAHVRRPLYHYRRTNAEAMTQNYSERNLEQLRENADMTIDFISRIRPDMADHLQYFKLQIKYPFLLMNPARRGFALWKEWWPEANAAIADNRYMPSHSRLAQRMAALRLWWGVRLYRSLISFYQRHR